MLAELGERVKPVSLARERTLAVGAPFDHLVPNGLVRGQVVSCQGSSARSVAFGLVSNALAEGAWMAVVDVTTFGTDSAAEFGVPLERVVRIDTGSERRADAGPTRENGADAREVGAEWVDVMGAAVDGFDIVLTRVPAELQGHGAGNGRSEGGLRPAAVRKLGTRVQQKGAVIVVLGSAGALGGDIELTTRATVWSGLSDGTGHLQRRVIDVQAAGRRMPNGRSCVVALTATGTRVDVSAMDDTAVDMLGDMTIDHSARDDRDVPNTNERGDRDPQAELVAEMADAVTVTDLADLADRRLAG